ncbi:MAG: AraC family transcriptional regulator [Pseudomonadota bacterium]
MDSLSSAIDRLALSATTFFHGTLCGSSPFEGEPGPGHLHFVRSGRLTVHFDGHASVTIEQPSLILLLPARTHRIETHGLAGAELVCAELHSEAGNSSVLPLGMPSPLVLTTADAPGLEATLNTLFAEADCERPGHRAATDRLVELLFILLLRHCLDNQSLQPGLLSGLADPQLAKSLLAMHDAPGHAWTLDDLAGVAAMSRARFAANFKERVGVPPGEYLTSLRITRAKTELRLGKPLKLIATHVGYANSTALTRAFKQRTGSSPREWLAGQ